MSPAQSRRIPILTYHSLDDTDSVLSVSPRDFAAHMRFLHDLGVETRTPRDIVCGDITDNTVVITFDDGFESVYREAFPLLARYGFTATVFLVTDYCEQTNTWPSQHADVMRQPLLRWHQVREMSAGGLHFGAHGRTHPDLTQLSREEIAAELHGSKQTIENVVGRAVDTFAYPYGAYNAVVKSVTAEHFVGACTACLGFVTPRSDPFALERVDAFYVRRPAVFRRLFSRELSAYLRIRRFGRVLRGQRG